jgi:hypothetical protein
MQAQNQLKHIVKDMTVYNIDEDTIGLVQYVYFGKDSAIEPIPEMSELKTELQEAMGGIKNFPPPVYTRLYGYGFVRICRGFFQSDLFVLPEQIADVDEDNVYLKVQTYQLLKG